MGKLFYGTQTGTAEDVAQRIQQAMPDLVDEVKCIMEVNPQDFSDCDFLILGGSTWGDGELTDDWVDFLPQLESISFSGKNVALFGLGDQTGYGYNFVSAMKVLYDKIKELGGNIVADKVSIEGFEFDHSESVIEEHFIGLAVDEVNEPELTDERIESWSQMVKNDLALVQAS